MIQPLRLETAFPARRLEPEEDLDSRSRLYAHVPLLVHVETVLGWQRGRVGPHRALALTGNIHVAELRAEIAFRGPSVNGSARTEEHRATAAILPPNFAMTIPLQYLPQPQVEDSDVWALTPSPEHLPWMEHYAGQLDGGPLTFDQHVPVDVTLDLTFTPDDCQSGRGALVDVAGELRFEQSTHMRILFRDPNHSTAPPLDDSDEAVLIVAGSRVPIPRQSVSSLTGRSPSMSVRVLEAGGREVCEEHWLGRPSWGLQ